MHESISVKSLFVPLTPRWKRVLDLSIIAITSPIWLPIMLMIGVLIKCVAGSPVLFVQDRVGLEGQLFRCVKFRTMKTEIDTSIHKHHLLDLMQSSKSTVKLDEKGDTRLLPFGLILRASGLDELPQILNVCRGEMSLVGPRPCLPYEYDVYRSEDKERFQTPPGLTGLWQVSGKST